MTVSHPRQTDTKRMEIDGHEVEFRFFLFDSSDATWTVEQRQRVDARVAVLERKRDTNKGGLSVAQEHELATLRTERATMIGPAYKREHMQFHDYGWMVTIDDVQRTGVFPAFDDAVEQARLLIGDLDA